MRLPSLVSVPVSPDTGESTTTGALHVAGLTEALLCRRRRDAESG